MTAETRMKLSNINFRREAWWLLLLATLVPLAGLGLVLLWRAGAAS